MEDLILVFQALNVQLLRDTFEKLKSDKEKGIAEFQSKNETQFFSARTLSLTFIQLTMLQRFQDYIKLFENIKEKEVMIKLANIYALWCLEKHIGHLYQFGIFTNPEQVGKIHKTLLNFCKDLVPEAVALTDVLSPPDFILNSFLGNADGDIYKHLQQSFFSSTNSFGRASYWSEIVPSKL